MRVSNIIAIVLLVFSARTFAEPSMDEVYKAAASGQMQQAQTMMQQVLQAHPDSAKAHFVAAELLARQGDVPAARAELQKALAINPSLSFAKPQAAQSLKNALGERASPINATASAPSLPAWIWPVGIGLVIGLFFWLARNRGNSTSNSNAPAQMAQSGYGQPSYPQQSSGPSLLSSLVTGAAIGGGIVAGEALAHRFLDGNEPRHDNATPPMDNSMGGNDFGVSDSGSWDDNSGSDW